MEIYAVKINGLKNPLGYCYDEILCSWKVRNTKGKKQAGVSIEVALDPLLRNKIYETSGAELDSLGVVLKIELKPRTRYYYRIAVTSDENETAQSEVCWFETAKLHEMWNAHWIGVNAGDCFHPEFKKEFPILKPVSEARLYICGLGLFEALINGDKAGNDFLAPFINDYKEHIQYCTYDVTSLLEKQNELCVLLGKGWYMGRFGLSGMARTDRNFGIIAELHISYTDGNTEVIVTDESWLYRGSVFELTDIYDGETQNYLLWKDKDNPWRASVKVNAPEKLTERYSPPLHDMDVIPVKKIIYTPTGETVLDFGQNFAGYVECAQIAPYGVTVKFEFCEILQDNNFYNKNYRTAKSLFTYISDGEKRIIHPHFTFFGFRYVKVSGYKNIDPSCFTGKAIYSEMEQTGFLETGNTKINRLHENTLWGLKSNFIDMPNDCPQRDERLGWTGDAQVFAPTAGYLMDTRAFYAKFIRDLRSDQQRNDGKVAIFLPNDYAGLCAGVWSDIAAFLPNMIYIYYGSKEMLAKHYPMMKDWVDSVRREDKKRGEKFLWDFGFQFGDWLALDGATEQSTFGRTDNGFIASMYYYASVSYVAKAAETLSFAEFSEYNELGENIKQAILNEYFTPSGRLSIDTQTGYLVALKFGVYIDKQRIIDGLKNRIKKDCYRIKGGFVGATMMNTVMADNGMTDLAYDFLLFEGFPGWLYAINLGATTIWERWNSVLPDGKINGAGMNSLNHYSYGSVMEFVYRHAAGISPLSPGFRKVRIAPKPDARLRYLNFKYDSVSGSYVSQWKINNDGKLIFNFEIPFGCEAEIILPEQETKYLTAGNYNFVIETKRDYLAPYSGETPIERLLNDPMSLSVLDEYLTDAIKAIDRNDMEDMSKSLSDMRNRTQLFRLPADAYDKAIKEIEKIKVPYMADGNNGKFI